MAEYAIKMSIWPLACRAALEEVWPQDFKVTREVEMPLMRVTLTPGAFDDEGKSRLVAALTEAACRAESVPDQPGHRMRALVLLQELAAGCFFSAGVCADAAIAGVFIDWQVSAGVLDGARKARFAEELQAAAISACSAAGDRLVVTSCVINEVPEGQWAQSGAIRRLPEIATLGGFEHLVPIAS